ncbi:hypothetical protein AHAS_Ahas20G0194700 [Arachis hypogaea]
MDWHLEQIRKHLGLPSIGDEDQSVKEKVEEKDEEAPVLSETSIKKEEVEVEVYEPRIPYS